MDLLPTFCAIAGAALPDGYVPDGVDQTAALQGKPTSARRKPIYWQWKTSTKRGDNWPTLAVREGDWKLLLGKAPQQVELFRFPNDRLERSNLRGEQAGEVRRLQTLLETWKATLPEKTNESCFSRQRSR